MNQGLKHESRPSSPIEINPEIITLNEGTFHKESQRGEKKNKYQEEKLRDEWKYRTKEGQTSERLFGWMKEMKEKEKKEWREGDLYLREQIIGRIEKWMEKYIREALNKKSKFHH